MSEKDRKIYIAGSTGMGGGAVKRRLESSGYTNLLCPTSNELDLINQAECEKFFSQKHPEIVILAAGKVGGILANNTYRAEFIYNNLMIESNVIHSSYLSGVKKLIFLGSSCIYPKQAPQPLKEEFLLTASLEATNEPYAIAKIAGIFLVADDFVLATGETHSVREFVEKTFEYLGIELEWRGTGNTERGVAIKIDKDILREKTGVGQQFVKKNQTVVKVSPTYFRPTEVDLLIGDSSKAKKAIGWNPKTKFEGLIKIMMDADLAFKKDPASDF